MQIEKFKLKNAFTLIEILLTLAIISVVILIGANIYFSVTKIQRRVAALQKVQDDVRYVLEKMSQSVRLGLINYDFYNDPNGDGSYDNGFDLYPQSGTNLEILAIIDQTENNIFYRKSGDKLQYCTGDQTYCVWDADVWDADYNWEDITPEGVKVSDLKFFITPSADPFVEITREDIGLGECQAEQYISYRSSGSDCNYYTDGHNFQPKVKIFLKAESSKLNIAQTEKMPIELQTIVTSRIPASEVMNENYE